ncbi:MAG: putative sulfite oxidase [Streptosporangiaceae bacterium]|nr:putative sulfite oxidase [Streptosporangiaceae bacterium]
MSWSCSRRRFLTYSTATAAGTYVLGKSRVSEAISPAVSPSGADDRVVKPAPSTYFVNRGPGSEEMRWGPVQDYGETVPNDRFYVHNRARPPQIDLGAWRLQLSGDAMVHPRSFSYQDLMALPQVTLRRTLDCGANCRAFFPRLPRSESDRWLPVGFTQWHFGAVGAAEWTGVRLRDVLNAVGLDHATYVRLTGLDDIAAPSGTAHYSQVIPAEKALKDDSLLAFRMNGADLPVDHGYPVRALLSGWGGNTSVKWLGKIEASKQKMPAAGPQDLQLLTGPDYPQPVRPTVGRVRSALELNEDVTLTPGDIRLRGRAWSGAGAIDHVDIAVRKLTAPGRWESAWDAPWRPAKLLSDPEPYMWTRFEVDWPGATPGQYQVMSRASDDAGNTQPRPEDVPWNQHGLGYYGHAPLDVVVLPDRS